MRGDVWMRLGVVAATIAFVGCQHPPNQVALRWLDQDCDVGEEGRLDLELRQQGASAESTLIRAFEHGPDGAILDEVADEAGNQYDEVAAALAAGRTYGLSAAEIAEIGAISKAAHVQRERERFARQYRGAALSGLGVLALPRGIDILRSVAADQQSDERVIAGVALGRAGVSITSP
jgi:hypothetical protein